MTRDESVTRPPFTDVSGAHVVQLPLGAPGCPAAQPQQRPLTRRPRRHLPGPTHSRTPQPHPTHHRRGASQDPLSPAPRTIIRQFLKASIPVALSMPLTMSRSAWGSSPHDLSVRTFGKPPANSLAVRSARPRLDAGWAPSDPPPPAVGCAQRASPAGPPAYSLPASPVSGAARSVSSPALID